MVLSMGAFEKRLICAVVMVACALPADAMMRAEQVGDIDGGGRSVTYRNEGARWEML